MKNVIIICFFLFSLLARSAEKLPDQEPFLSIQITEGAFTGPETKKSGVFFYSRDPGKGIMGPILEIYFLSQGEVTKHLSGGSTSAETIRAIKKIGLTNFDYRKEKVSLDKRLRAEAEAKGEQYFPPIVLDGAEYKISYELDGHKFSLKEWNPGSEIYYYAEHSPKIRKLRDVINELCIYYGRLAFGVY